MCLSTASVSSFSKSAKSPSASNFLKRALISSFWIFSLASADFMKAMFITPVLPNLDLSSSLASSISLSMFMSLMSPNSSSSSSLSRTLERNLSPRLSISSISSLASESLDSPEWIILLAQSELFLCLSDILS
ncbi:hypothetical protein WICPIJ_010149 [Wickerhamomyces pijperi]|uniref:Uncharacterized protein n=1 Tax=Wickerhamomyces pijperi TaxID=599730 RepID=A0A9P8PI73_WICPI|nr:hypothetical protein WICPIJ_010149 [Wickerhamomyces pijperi]